MSGAQPFQYFVVDAFTAQRFQGSPAAVVLGADPLDEAAMRSIAGEFSLGATAFVRSAADPQAAVRIEVFGPREPADPLGHAAAAAVHALIESGRFVTLAAERGMILPIQWQDQVLTARCEMLRRPDAPAFLVWLDLPAPEVRPKTCVPRLWAEPLGMAPDAFDPDMPAVQSHDGDLILFVRDTPALFAAAPDAAALPRWLRQQRVRGVCLATTRTLAPSIDVQSRFFPAGGAEAAISGAIHGPLGACLAARGLGAASGDTTMLQCIQTGPDGRAGLIRVVVAGREAPGWRVRIAAECVTVMRGELRV